MITYCEIFRALPGCYLIVDVTPDYKIIDASDAYLRLTEKDRDIIGKPLFEVFPDSEGNNEYAGVKSLKKSLEKVRATMTADIMGIQRYDIQSSESKQFRVSFWKPANLPVLNESGEMAGIIHAVQDITRQTVLRNQLRLKDDNIQQQISDAVSTTQELERIEIGRELHDNINQLLITAKLFIGRALSKDPLDKALTESGYSLIEKAIESLKAVSSALLNSTDQEDSLLHSIEEIIKQVIRSGDFKVEKELLIPDEALIESKVKVAILRIIQEQMANIIQHAEARNLFLKIHFAENHVKLSLRDDGKGFNISEIKPGLGFHNMRSRVTSMNGTISIVSAPGDGCHIHISIPVQAQTKILQ